MPYAHLAEKPDASVMAKPFILNTSMDNPEGSLSIRDPMATLFLDPSPTSNFLYPISFTLPMIHIYSESKYPLPKSHFIIMYHPITIPYTLLPYEINLI